MNVKVKICGIRSKKSAFAAINAGVDFLGFNFVPSSKRYINPLIAKTIINNLKGRVKIVGVFQNADVSYVNELVNLLGLDFVQLHGEEDKKHIRKIERKIIKRINIDPLTPLRFAKDDEVEYFLLDRKVQGKGEMVDTEMAKVVTNKHSIFLAGGLTPQNVATVIKKVQPFAVDVASGIETNGIENPNKIKEFIKNAKAAFDVGKGVLI